MNTKRTIKIAGLLIAIGFAILGALSLKRQLAALAETQQTVSLNQPARARTPMATSSAVPTNSPAQAAVPVPPTEVATPPTEAAGAARPMTPPQTSQYVAPPAIPATKPPGSGKAPAQDPLAREALSFVGADPEANLYWATAINNPDLPDEERKDLIEDLNEDGLSDPKHPGPQDLPLILNRIQIIQQLGPYAMDQVNADAFMEVYKDLVNMVQGKPVQ